jgi:xanthine dehydrogenase accessory factor
MTGWVGTLRRSIAEQGAAVMVTIAGASGSTPRMAGTRMIVDAAGAHGTIGGGNLEFRALDTARDLLGDTGQAAPQVHAFPLGPTLGQCCGGHATLLFERVTAADADWLDHLEEPLRRGIPASVVTRLDTGAKMVVSAGRCYGTLGGGDTDRAAAALVSDRPESQSRLVELEATGDDSSFGLFIDVVQQDEAVLALFGAGHVGKALVRILGTLPGWRIKWIDSRAEQFPETVPDSVEVCLTDEPADEVADLPPGAFALVMTHSHASDYEICERLLRRGDTAFCGLIGSGSKRGQFLKRLAHRGMPPEAVARLTCPIGVAGVGGKHPAEIAVAAAAQLLQVRGAMPAAVALEEMSA